MSNWRQMMPTPDAYLLNKVLFDLHHKAGDLESYHEDKESYLSRYPLSDVLKAQIRDGDVAQLYLSGVNPYILRAHCIGMKIPEAVSVGALHRLAETSDEEARNV